MINSFQITLRLNIYLRYSSNSKYNAHGVAYIQPMKLIVINTNLLMVSPFFIGVTNVAPYSFFRR